jgi:germination protein, Ger(x)C family
MKKITYLFVPLLLIPILLSGCTHDFSRKEIDEVDLALVLGIDYTNGEYSLSALYSSGGGSDPEKKGSGDEKVAQGKGKTAYAALEDLKRKNKKSITLAHTGSFLIGDGAAKQGLKESLDFLSRDETIKMEGLIYVIKDKSASDFIKTGLENKQTIHEDLEAIKQKQQENLTRNDNTVVNMLNDMDQTLSSVLIPYLIADKSGYVIQGYTVFDQFKLKDYLDRETSDGVDFIKNVMRQYPIYLKDEVSLQVSYTKTKLKAKLRNNEVTVSVKLNFESSVKEVLADKDVFTREELDKLTKEQNDYIEDILNKAILYSKITGLDILNLARIVENQNYQEWKGIKGNWAQMISEINYEYDINSRISKSFILGS